MPNINKKKDRWFVPKAKTGNQQGRKEKSKEYNTVRWRRFRQAVLQRDKYLCQECLRKGIHTPVGDKRWDHAVDHIKEVRDGGKFYDMSNVETLCSTCHNRKSGRKSRGVG